MLCHSELMIWEIATFDITPGAEDAFRAAFQQAAPLLSQTPGFDSMQMTQGIETPNRFVLLVRWGSVAAHLENFRGSERFAQWRALLGPHFASPPHVEHYTDVSQSASDPR